MEKIPSWQRNLGGYGLVVQDGNLNLTTSIKWMFIFDIQETMSKFYESMQNADDEIDDPWELFDADEFCIFSSEYGGGVSCLGMRKAGGIVRGEKPWAGEKTGPCYGGIEIKRIASVHPGMSWPLRYIAFAKAAKTKSGIFADRESLSDDALEQYRSKFGRFQKKPFDNVFDPKTPDPNDDCITYSPHYPNMEMVDYLYSFDGSMPAYYAEMRANYDKFVQAISEIPKGRKKGLWKKTNKSNWNYESIKEYIDDSCSMIAEMIFDESLVV